MEELIKKYFGDNTDIHLKNGYYIAIRNYINIYKECEDGTGMIIYKSIFNENEFEEVIINELGVKEGDYIN